MDDKLWFKQLASSSDFNFIKHYPIVYFCAEYALSDAIPTYAGGLGVLAGDIIREAADQNIPLITVGLYYHKGYIYHDIYQDEILGKGSASARPLHSGLDPVMDTQGNRIIVKVLIQDTPVYIQAWKLSINSVTVYLLDTDINLNREKDRHITDQLYTSDKEIRFKQEIVLGMGGLRVLDALGISPMAYHLNEGHSALLGLEFTRCQMAKHKNTFDKELENSRQHIFFTNHTLIPVGNDTFDTDLVTALLSGFAKEIQVPISEILELGLITESNIFSMTLLALRMANKVNAVSKLHAQNAKQIWKQYPIIPITNGIHISTWDNIETEENTWKKHQKNKSLLLDYVYNITGVEWDKDTLLLGWARRIVGYKRPLALFDNLEHFKSIANSSNKPVRVIISGIVHESDAEGLVILDKLNKLVTKDLEGIVVYLPEYNMTSAKLLTSGCDVWVNTPVVGFEACGTSGMKAALNGVLPCSTKDGWIAEANLYEVGWTLNSDDLSNDILSTLEHQIVETYYNRDSNLVSAKWVKMMHNARQMVLNQFSATKMLRGYFEEFYLPIIHAHQDN